MPGTVSFAAAMFWDWNSPVQSIPFTKCVYLVLPQNGAVDNPFSVALSWLHISSITTLCNISHSNVVVLRCIFLFVCLFVF